MGRRIVAEKLINEQELEDLFSAAAPAKKAEDKGGAAKAGAPGKPQKVSLVDLKKANNCLIMLTKIKLTYSEIVVSRLDHCMLLCASSGAENVVSRQGPSAHHGSLYAAPLHWWDG